MNSTHIQGSGREASERYALTKDGRVLMVMTFVKHDKWEWELLRMAAVGKVRGGASKLLSAFVEEHNPRTILCYADRCWSVRGSVYEKIGFAFDGVTEPDMCYVEDERRVSRQKFQRHKLESMGLCSPGDARSASEILEENRIYSIHGPGHIRYVWKPASAR